MEFVEKPGFFYLGKVVDPKGKKAQEAFLYDSKNLTTHAVCVGMTGSGKTGLGIDLLEECGLNGIPAIIIDPKGDLGDLKLTFPDLSPQDFLPWIDAEEASRKKLTTEEYASVIAKNWKEGLQSWGLGKESIEKFNRSVEVDIYTPASQAGIPISIMQSFVPPPPEIMRDPTTLRDLILSTTSSLLGLLGIQADPIKSREHILISTILERAWQANQALDLPGLIREIMTPPFDKVGVFDTETFFPSKDRQALSMRLNNLIASPGFQAWLTGEPLDIQNLLYTKEGKPKLSVMTIAHLSDPERMFFVTLLLNALLAWMRRQTGTSQLRALLYMDEIFGYFPPTASPPSKTPMLTLLKQARAFGLGIVLATQNPIDLDYKGLSNCGSWFIGKLQTERDKTRVADGLSSTSNGVLTAAEIEKLLAKCGQRVFLLRSVHLPEPLLFESRWTLSYLRGPLTLPQIEKVMGEKRANTVSSDPTSEIKNEKPILPPGLQEYFMVEKTQSGKHIFHAKALGIGKLHFVDTKKKIDTWQQIVCSAPLSDDRSQPSWEAGQVLLKGVENLSKTVPKESTFENLPTSFFQAKNLAQISKGFAEYLYQSQTFDLFEIPDIKMISKPEESEVEFRNRISSILQEKVAIEEKKIRERYASKIAKLQDKLQKMQTRASTKKSQMWRKVLDALLSFLTTILAAMQGRKVLSKGSISQAGTSLRKAEKISKEQADASQAEESLENLQQQLQELQKQQETELEQIRLSNDPNRIQIDKTAVRPRKSDIMVESIGILWES